ncbi:hypothetical protein N5K37_15270 [Delftia tsuruhatensis]|uniref:Minor tail protein n=1 Tax=Delftia tsuruhatensis TaxID=180282 RepID=A0AAX3STC1_9BURK|nr:hypothetical protein [Delftia tsuruhatensis]AOV01897.1 hypothetical protein BI380_11295 [Delftia tsuruhatensis]MDH2231263.1 hypothetical protein [Delftia tsuruhatensis]WFF83158.1 hypothetical protein PYR84_10810 [Delftia tsuruhatensis]
MSLDAVISADLLRTRAEITALSTALAAARSEIAGLNTLMTGNSVIKSVQRGTVSIHYNASDPTIINIAAVAPSKCLLSFLGSTGYLISVPDYSFANLSRLRLLDSTRLEVNRSTWGTYSSPVTLSWEVVEFN